MTAARDAERPRPQRFLGIDESSAIDYFPIGS